MLLLLSAIAIACAGYIVGAALNYPRGFDDGAEWEYRRRKQRDIRSHRFTRVIPPLPVSIPPEAESPEHLPS